MVDQDDLAAQPLELAFNAIERTARHHHIDGVLPRRIFQQHIESGTVTVMKDNIH